jgi:hypothetical protein
MGLLWLFTAAGMARVVVLQDLVAISAFEEPPQGSVNHLRLIQGLALDSPVDVLAQHNRGRHPLAF